MEYLVDSEQLKKESIENLDGQFTFSKLRRFRKFYFAGKPTREGFEQLKAQGVTSLVDINEPGEDGQPEKQWADELNLRYVNIPVGGCHALSVEKIKEVSRHMDHDSEEGTLLYCMSGNRVSSWFASHLCLEYGFTPEEAMDRAKQTGMDKPPMIEGTMEVMRNLNKI